MIADTFTHLLHEPISDVGKARARHLIAELSEEGRAELSDELERTHRSFGIPQAWYEHLHGLLA